LHLKPCKALFLTSSRFLLLLSGRTWGKPAGREYGNQRAVHEGRTSCTETKHSDFPGAFGAWGE